MKRVQGPSYDVFDEEGVKSQRPMRPLLKRRVFGIPIGLAVPASDDAVRPSVCPQNANGVAATGRGLDTWCCSLQLCYSSFVVFASDAHSFLRQLAQARTVVAQHSYHLMNLHSNAGPGGRACRGRCRIDYRRGRKLAGRGGLEQLA